MRKEVKIFSILGAIFIANVLLAEFIGVKIFSLSATLGAAEWSYTMLGQPMTLQYTAGVLIWPVVFILTDIINDYYGKKGVQFLTYLAVAISIYCINIYYVHVLYKAAILSFAFSKFHPYTIHAKL